MPGGWGERIAGTPRWLLLLAVAVAVRAITFGNPVLHVDEEFYFVTAGAMWDGAIPYVDVWDRKPVGLFLLYLPAAALGLPMGIWAYQAMALASVTATALLIAGFADRAGWRRGALPAAIAYILWLNLLEGQGGQAPVFYNLLVAGAAWLLAPRRDDPERPARRFAQGLGAMALVGLALQIKYSPVFEGLFFGLWWMVREHRLGRPMLPLLAMAGALAAAALAPTLAAWAAYAAMGHGEAWWFANVASILARQPDPLLERLGNLAQIVLIVSPLAALAAIGWRMRVAGETAEMQRWLFAWAAAAVAGLLVFGSWFDHYALPLLVPLCACAAGFLSEHRHRRRGAILMLLFGLIAGQVTLWTKRANRGDAAELAALARAVGHGDGCLYVYSGTTMLYPATGRCRATRFLFPSHLGRTREQGATGVDQRGEILRILDSRPEVVVVRKPYRGERAELRSEVVARLTRDYRLEAVAPMGRDRLSVYRKR